MELNYSGLVVYLYILSHSCSGSGVEWRENYEKSIRYLCLIRKGVCTVIVIKKNIWKKQCRNTDTIWSEHNERNIFLIRSDVLDGNDIVFCVN